MKVSSTHSKYEVHCSKCGSITSISKSPVLKLLLELHYWKSKIAIIFGGWRQSPNMESQNYGIEGKIIINNKEVLIITI